MQESQSAILNLKSIKLSADEQHFIKEYRKLEELEREKGIKFFQCIGDPPHTERFVQGVEVKRQMYIDQGLNDMRHRDCNRFATVTNEDKVVVPVTATKEITTKPKWDAFQNNHFAMRKRLVNIFLRVSNKLISRLRAGKRLAKLKHWIQGNGIKNRAEMKAMVAEDWKIA